MVKNKNSDQTTRCSNRQAMKKAKREPKTFIMRWRPEISDYSWEEYIDTIRDFYEWGMHWAIFDWEDARKGDSIYMLCEGKDGFEGILFTGTIRKAPIKGESWRGDGSTQYYADMDCQGCNSITFRPIIPVEELERAIPDFNWRKGHSGEELTAEQAEKIELLWRENWNKYSEEYSGSNIYGEDYGEDSLHVMHLDTVDDDFLGLMRELNASPETNSEIAANGDRVIIDCGEAPLNLRMIATEKKEGIEINWIFPVVRDNDTTAEMRLTEIREYHHGLEAELTVEYGEATFTFYDTDYYANKDTYRIGESYLFSLTGIAYGIHIVPKDQRFITLPAAKAIECGFQVEPGEKEIIIQSDTVVAFIQLDDNDPCEAEFQSPLQETAQRIVVYGREFYRLNICIVPEAPDGEHPMLTIPVFVRKANFSGRPKRDEPIAGCLWLQGRLVKKPE